VAHQFIKDGEKVNKQPAHTPRRERRLWFLSRGRGSTPAGGEKRVRPDGRALFLWYRHENLKWEATVAESIATSHRASAGGEADPGPQRPAGSRPQTTRRTRRRAAERGGPTRSGAGAAENARKARRQTETEVEELEQRAKKSRERLASVKSNKEYQAMLKEIEDLQGFIRQREDQILEQMEAMERHRAVLKEEERAVAKAREHLEAEGAEIQGERAKADAQMVVLRKNRSS